MDTVLIEDQRSLLVHSDKLTGWRVLLQHACVCNSLDHSKPVCWLTNLARSDKMAIKYSAPLGTTRYSISCWHFCRHAASTSRTAVFDDCMLLLCAWCSPNVFNVLGAVCNTVIKGYP